MRARGGELRVACWTDGRGGGCWSPRVAVDALSDSAASPGRSGSCARGFMMGDCGRSAPERGVPFRARGMDGPRGLITSPLVAVACGAPHEPSISTPSWEGPAPGPQPSEGRPAEPQGCEPVVPRCFAGLPVAAAVGAAAAAAAAAAADPLLMKICTCTEEHPENSKHTTGRSRGGPGVRASRHETRAASAGRGRRFKSPPVAETKN